MQRKIKLRVWDKERQKFLIPYPFTDSTKFDLGGGTEPIPSFLLGGNGDLVIYSSGNIAYPVCHKENYIIQQSTGQVDKDGEELFEGDIVKLGWNTTDVSWSGMMAEIVWWQNGFYFEVGKESLAQDTYYQFKHCKLVGNVNQNPELLK